jgi:hypothetical protein
MKLRLFIAIMALTVTALACSSGTPEPDRITATHLYQDDGSGNAGAEVTAFAPSDRTMHFMVETNNLVTGHIKWVFTAVDTSDGQDIEITTVEGDLSEVNNLTADLTLPNDWPTGSYKVDIYLNDAMLGTINYTVQ